MLWNRKELKQKGKTLFMSKYWDFVIFTLLLGLLTGSEFIKFEIINLNQVVYLQISLLGFNIVRLTGSIVALSGVISLLFTIFFTNVIHVGGAKFFLDSIQHDSSMSTLFYGFKNGYKNIVIIQLLQKIKIFLWGLLFVVPGIIKSIEYAMIPFLLAENPHIDKDEAFRKSKEMMDGHKWDYFVLVLSFIGWILLDFISFGLVSIFWTNSYINSTEAYIYLLLKQQDHINYDTVI